MCFTPEISLTTFVVEIVLGVWILSRGYKKPINQVGAAILFLLGIYQFAEFMICASENPLVWGKFAHLIYTFLPALGLHWTYALMERKGNLFAIYSLPIGFSALAITTANFVKSAECTRYFINVFYEWSQSWFYGYGIYFCLFIIIAAVLLINSLIKENNKRKRKIYGWGLIGFLAFTMPVYILILFFPVLSISFPSVLCEFALLFGIAVTYVVHLNEKKR